MPLQAQRSATELSLSWRDQAIIFLSQRDLHIDGPLFMLEWFMCIYARDLPFTTVLRIWDIFFCEGNSLQKSHLYQLLIWFAPIYTNEYLCKIREIHCNWYR